MRIGFDLSPLERGSRGVQRVVARVHAALLSRDRVELVPLVPEPGRSMRAFRLSDIPNAVRREGLAERIVETLVIAIQEIPGDEHLSALMRSGDPFEVSSALDRSFVQDEMLALSDGDRVLSERDRDELAEILLRLLKSYLQDPGPKRTEAELRRLLSRWLIPVIEEKLESAASDGARDSR